MTTAILVGVAEGKGSWAKNSWGSRPAGYIGMVMSIPALMLAGCASTVHSAATTVAHSATTTTECSLNATGQSVPVYNVCSSNGAPHFGTPQTAMVYLANAWNSHNVQEIDYVTDPAGRQQMDSMSAQMPNLTFKSCAQNPAGDYTCYFSHDIVSSISSTTYPNPGNYPPGEAVFTVAPAEGPGWYLTNVIHCG